MRESVHDAFMRGPEHVIELFHGYTYSAHPLACAAGLADARSLPRRKPVRAGTHSKPIRRRRDDAQGLPNVLDIRTVGLVAGIDLASRPGGFGKRACAAMDRAFRDEGLLIRVTGDTIAIARR